MKKQLTTRVYVQHVPIDDLDQVGDKVLELPNTYDSELFILRLTDYRLVELLLLRYLGFDYLECVKIMRLKNIGEFYFLWGKLKTSFKKYRESEDN